MAEIKKINGNTLCDEVARAAAEEAKAAADVQADWGENDPESPAHIKNRIGGYKRSEAERLVEYDETTAEYIEVDVTGTGTAYRYRKASDTLVHKDDWVGGKTVIVMDDGNGEQETTLDIGTGESGAIDIIEKEYAAGKIWLTAISEIVCGIIAPQDTDLSASADGVSAVTNIAASTVVPKGVWIADLPYMANLISNGTQTAYHKAVYCSGVKKIPEEYLETTTAEEAKTTAEEAKTTAEEAKTTAEEIKKTDIINLEQLESENVKTIYVYSSGYTSPKYHKTYVYSTELPEAFCLKFGNDKGEIAADTGLPYWCRKVNVKNISGKTVGVQLFGCAMSGEKLITIEGKSLTSTKLIDVTYTKEEYPYFYTAGDGIAIEDGVISADVSGKLDAANPVATGSFSLGRKTGTAEGDSSVAVGKDATATGAYSHAEGNGTTAQREASHAEGYGTTAGGAYSHAEGLYAKATGKASHGEGYYTEAAGDYAHAEGKFNVVSTTDAHVVGNGTSGTARSNAHTLDWSGNAWYAGDVYVGSTSGTNKDEGSERLAKVSEIPDVSGKLDKENPVVSGKLTFGDGSYIGNASDDIKNVAWFGKQSSYQSPAPNQFVCGLYANLDSAVEGSFVFGGNGSTNRTPKNAYVVYPNGDGWYAGDVYVGSTSNSGKDSSSVKLAKVTETVSTADTATEATEFYLKSSTAGSTKRFKITVTDDGTLTATEVV